MPEKCVHDKSFSPYILASNPPQREWICRKCGEKGYTGGEPFEEDDYFKIIEKFERKKDEGI